MIANLPLLFANGNPSALSKINAAELEKFITFMVTCSWGHDTAKDIRQPPWWPRDVDFSHPFKRPAELPKDWESRLKNVVKKCYDFHKSAFLLVFSAQLARYPRHRLRYVDNLDHTTTVYCRRSGRLLVTFRNENIHYDKDTPISSKEEDLTVKSADIYLCDTCDSHFDNLDVLKVHERLCNNDNIPSSNCNGGLPEFLSALKLKSISEEDEEPKIIAEYDTKLKNSRNVANIDRGPPYPFSSLAYQRSIKSHSNRDSTYSRERIERYCDTSATVSKTVVSKSKNHQFPIRYKRPIDYWHRKHIFPNQRNKKILDLKAQLLTLKCRPIKVHVERMSNESMQEYIESLRKEAESRVQLLEDKDIEFVDEQDANIKRDQPSSATVDPLKHTDIDCEVINNDYEVIDLCSDDETPVVNENCDPRAGVTCVMRGGAVLRRTAATPRVLPAEPCGARQRPLSAAVLQPHPVILIAHTLNNLQTISLD